MKKRSLSILQLLFFCSTIYAQNPPLRVVVASFVPPYVMQSGNNQVFGYDIAMMESICRLIQRDCQFDSMTFSGLIPALINNQADAAVGAIAITPKRAQTINLSSAYLPSRALFLATNELAKQRFSLTALNNKTIGVEKGMALIDKLEQMNLKNAEIVEYDNEEEIVEALAQGDIDITLMDAPTANYWALQSGGLLTTVGEPMPYAYGLGIAINPQNSDLLSEINEALEVYLKSRDFKKNYNKYFGRGY